MPKQFTVSPAQMKKAEAACESKGTTCAMLMRNVGSAIAGRISRLVKPCVCAILAGSGNNGGDGFALAHCLKKRGFTVNVILVGSLPKTELAKECYEEYKSDFSSVISYPDEPQKALEAVSGASVIADCVYGTGFHGELPADVRRLFAVCNKSAALRFSADIASGCNAADGSADEYAFRADMTFALGAVKTGQLYIPCSEYSGDIVILDIGIGEDCYSEYDAELNNDSLADHFVNRSRITHKGSFGRLLNVSGSENCVGAAWLSTNAALCTGTGLVTLASVKEVTTSVSSTLHECIYLPLGSGSLSADCTDKLCANAKTASAVLFGCGVGNSDESYRVLSALIENTACPIIIDADGINSLAPHINELKDNTGRLILTPHIKEFSRISGLDTDYILKHKLPVAKEFAAAHNVHILLKDAYSVYASPDGFTAVNMSGNAALAKGGSGDTLAGTIGGLLAQGIDIPYAVRLGAYLFGLSAQYAARDRSMSGILPSQLPQLYPYILREFFGIA